MFRVDTAKAHEVIADEASEELNVAWDEYEQLYYPDRARTYARVLDQIPNGGGLHLLDVGSALGWFMEMATQRGYTTCGIEPSKEVALLGQQRTGRPVEIGLLENTSYPGHFFHVVTMFDVLEHTINPVVCLQEVRRLLVDNGLLVVRVPDLDGLLPRVSHCLQRVTLGHYSKPVRLLWRFHRWGFNWSSLERLFAHDGFDILAQYGEDAQGLSAMKYKHWARNPIVVAGVTTIIHLSRLLGLWDERVVIARKQSAYQSV